MRRTRSGEIDTEYGIRAVGESMRERDLRAVPRSHTWNVPTDSSVQEFNAKRYLQLLWISPVLVTLLGVFFLFLSDEKPWLPWLAFALAIVNVIANLVETRKVKARAARETAGSEQ
jgi:hypothetical protein